MIGYGVRKLVGLNPTRPVPSSHWSGAVKWGGPPVEVHDPDRLQLPPRVTREDLDDLIHRDAMAVHEPTGLLVGPRTYAMLDRLWTSEKGQLVTDCWCPRADVRQPDGTYRYPRTGTNPNCPEHGGTS